MKPHQSTILDYEPPPGSRRTPGDIAGLTLFCMALAGVVLSLLGLIYEWWTGQLLKPW